MGVGGHRGRSGSVAPRKVAMLHLNHVHELSVALCHDLLDERTVKAASVFEAFVVLLVVIKEKDGHAKMLLFLLVKERQHVVLQRKGAAMSQQPQLNKIKSKN